MAEVLQKYHRDDSGDEGWKNSSDSSYKSDPENDAAMAKDTANTSQDTKSGEIDLQEEQKIDLSQQKNEPSSKKCEEERISAFLKSFR